MRTQLQLIKHTILVFSLFVGVSSVAADPNRDAWKTSLFAQKSYSDGSNQRRLFPFHNPGDETPKRVRWTLQDFGVDVLDDAPATDPDA